MKTGNEVRNKGMLKENLLEVLGGLGVEEVEGEGYRYYRVVTGCRDAGYNLVCYPEVSRERDVDAINGFFEERGLPFSWWFEEGERLEGGGDLAGYLKGKGFTSMGEIKGMIKGMDGYEVREEGEKWVEVREIRAEGEFREWVRVMGQVFELKEETEEYYYRVYLSALGREDQVSFGAYVGGELVGTGSICIKDGVGGLYDGAVVKGYRRRGIMKEMYRHRLNYLKERGGRYGVIEVNEMSRGLAEGFGFKEVGGYGFWGRG